MFASDNLQDIYQIELDTCIQKILIHYQTIWVFHYDNLKLLMIPPNRLK